MPRTGVSPEGSSYASGSESESLKRLWNRRGVASSSSLESAKRLLKVLERSAGAFDFGAFPNVEDDLGRTGIGGGSTSLIFFLNLPPGDSDLILNLEDFTGSGVGEDGRIDCRIAGCAGGGEMARTGAAALIVGAESDLIEERIEYWPWFRRPCARVRWKLLAEASESLSFGAETTGFTRDAGGML